MRIQNVIVVYDVYCVTGDDEQAPQHAREEIIRAIQNGELAPSDQNAIPVSMERAIRETWKDERPFVAADVTDAEFETLKGKTTLDIFNMLHVKELTASGRGKKSA